MTPVKDQGACGDCWAFSTTGNIEGQWALYTKQLVVLSEQELVSCDSKQAGCAGGVMNMAYDWLLEKRNGSISTNESFPYSSGSGSPPMCYKHGKSGANITGHQNLPHDETQMMGWLPTGGPSPSPSIHMCGCFTLGVC